MIEVSPATVQEGLFQLLKMLNKGATKGQVA